jgi:hypothetical protein
MKDEYNENEWVAITHKDLLNKSNVLKKSFNFNMSNIKRYATPESTHPITVD